MLKDRVRNEDMRQMTQAVTEWIDSKRKEWKDHLSKMIIERIVRIAKYIPIGMRSLERPKRRWKDLFHI